MKPLIKVKPPGPKAKEVISRDSKVISQSMKREYPLVLERAYGVNLEDVDGNRYLDFTSGIAVMNFGWSNPKILEAVRNQIEKVMHGAFLDLYSELPVRLAEELVRFLPEGLNKVYFSNSGTESIEAAMKLARYHTKRKYFISFYGSFHGRTYGALSLTSTKVIQRTHFGPFLSVIHAPYPNPYRCPVGSDPETCDLDTIRYIEDEIFKTEVSPEEVAAIFVEPVQGEGGYVIPPITFIKHLRKLCDKNGILLVDDEVQASCFRTGKFLAIEHFNVKPDIVCISKAIGGWLPLGLTVANDKIMSWPRGSHASTFGGNLAACAASLAVLELMKDENLGKSVIEKGKYILNYLRDLQEEVELIGYVRGLGLMIGVEFVENRKTKEPAIDERDIILKRAFENGLALLSAGESVIRLVPPLTIKKEDIDTALEIFSKAVKSLNIA